ncbi:hypothetical protein JT359_01465 [Candidatus Poribacteria bacterium]|nr:hypothetical protein [Candidatus Poribacteria bacterium]
MRLEEKHKIFAVKGFAQFMKLSEIVASFMDKFDDEIMQICDINLETEEQFFERFVAEQSIVYYNDGLDLGIQDAEDHAPSAYAETVRKMQKKASKHISARLRRFNINHRQFPNKYTDLFNKTRDLYIAKYKCNNLHQLDILSDELGTLYGLAKSRAFEEGDAKYIALTHQILKTAATSSALAAQYNEQQDAAIQQMESIEDSQNHKDDSTEESEDISTGDHEDESIEDHEDESIEDYEDESTEDSEDSKNNKVESIKEKVEAPIKYDTKPTQEEIDEYMNSQEYKDECEDFEKRMKDWDAATKNNKDDST